ncbi:GumC family protein [Phenylobacterium montanum]|uniref:Lipopolysaccharide biosynthesis protein n=1 Tax=Phenylobacterium montanum TaxID=2823693 RepID=A0A975G0Z9_9CAUL|nr:Wzz/FepE/Etk N-terminal domain-containing protein [Caulobacter sp. S6]QUD88553.1 lipopolysaccharide biosynthesis protein [Caulobacter sp. S6]
MTSAAWPSQTPYAAPPRAGDAVRVRVRYDAADIAALLWREWPLMLTVFLGLAVLGVGFALTLKTAYPAQSSILVRLGQEYVYQPSVGDAARGAVPENDQVVQSEVEILSSPQLKQLVIGRIGLATLYPSLARAANSSEPGARQEAIDKAVGAMQKSLKIDTAPGAPVVRLSFTHTDPAVAAQTLNTLVDLYVGYRRTVLLDQTQPLEDQRRTFEARLAQADEAYENFLGSNNIGDFEAEKASLAQLQASLQQQKFAADASLKEKQGRLAALSAQVGQVAPEVGLYHDLDHQAQDKLTELKVQRGALLSRYRPDAQPVRDLDNQIAALEKGIGDGSLQGEGARRMGVNPVYQTVQADRLQMAAEVAALQQSSRVLAQQIEQVTERQLRLAQLEPQYQDLSRDRDVLQSNVRDFTVKEQQSQAAAAIARQSNDNISIVQRATPPVQGKSLKRPVMLLAILMAAFTAVCAGLVRVFLRPGLPSAASASRTLDLPILATAAAK